MSADMRGYRWPQLVGGPLDGQSIDRVLDKRDADDARYTRRDLPMAAGAGYAIVEVWADAELERADVSWRVLTAAFEAAGARILTSPLFDPAATPPPPPG